MSWAVMGAQLMALRAQVEAMIAVVDDEMRQEHAAGQQREPPTCPHTETENVGTFGASVMRCTLCKEIVP
jgi:hypothetical protein